MGGVFARRVQEDRNAIEGGALRRRLLNEPRDLDAFTRLTRPRVESDAGVERTLGRVGGLEEMALHPRLHRGQDVSR